MNNIFKTIKFSEVIVFSIHWREYDFERKNKDLSDWLKNVFCNTENDFEKIGASEVRIECSSDNQQGREHFHIAKLSFSLPLGIRSLLRVTTNCDLPKHHIKQYIYSILEDKMGFDDILDKRKNIIQKHEEVLNWTRDKLPNLGKVLDKMNIFCATLLERDEHILEEMIKEIKKGSRNYFLTQNAIFLPFYDKHFSKHPTIIDISNGDQKTINVNMLSLDGKFVVFDMATNIMLAT